MLKTSSPSKRRSPRWRFTRSLAALILMGGMALGAAGAVWTKGEDDALLAESIGAGKPDLLMSQSGSHDETTARRPKGSAALNPNKRWYKNARQKDKGDDAPYFHENAQKADFDPCMTATGEVYEGPGTVLNPYAKESPCLGKRRAARPSTPIDFPLAEDDVLSLPAPGPQAGEGPAYTKEDFLLDLAVLWPPTGPVGGGGHGFGGGGVPPQGSTSSGNPVVSVDPPAPSEPIVPDDPRQPDEPADEPTGDEPDGPTVFDEPLVPVVIPDDPPPLPNGPDLGGDPTATPLPGGLVLFLSGAGAIAATRKKKRV